MANRTGINARYSGINATIPGAAPPSFVDTQQEPYRLESHQQDGTLLHFLPNWWAGSWNQKTLSPETLQFSYDATNEFASDFVFPNEIWLYKGDNTTPQQKFIIVSPEDTESEGYVFTVQAKSLLYQLAKETIPFYEVTEATSISTILGAILALQTQTPAIGLGKIDADIGNATRIIRYENKTILTILLDLQRSIGGYFTVDVNRRLNWKRTIGFDLGHQIRLGKNSTVITRRPDYSDIATRMIGLGAGVDKDIRLSVTVNDATAQSNFGIITGVFNDQSITDIDMLTAATTAELNRRKVARVTYDIGTIDLSQDNSDLDYSFEATALTPGTKVNIIGGQSDVDIYTRVQDIDIPLDTPSVGVTIGVSNPDAGTDAWGNNEPRQSTSKSESLEMYLVELFKKADILQNDIGVINTIKRAIDGGTIETPPSAPNELSSMQNVVWYNPNTTTPSIGPPDKEEKEDAIADALTEVLDAAGTGDHSQDIYDDLVSEITTTVGGLTWGGEVGTLPTLPTDVPKVVYYKSADSGSGDDQLWIGYNGSGSSDQWTPMQFTTDKSGGTPT
jgi:phage minor structural protein